MTVPIRDLQDWPLKYLNHLYLKNDRQFKMEVLVRTKTKTNWIRETSHMKSRKNGLLLGAMRLVK